ncbi:MAG: hypothetical protein WBQ36_04470 [Desulfobaccales bacterium]
MVRLKADSGVGGVSYKGQEYPVVRGCVEIPEEAANELLGFGWGFTLAPKQPAPEQEATQADTEQPTPEAVPKEAAPAKGKKQ